MAKMKTRLVGLATAAGLALAPALAASSAWADPEVMVKCDGDLAQGMRFTAASGWQPFANPDRSVVITRDKGKLAIIVEGDLAYSSGAVFALPQSGVRSFRVMRGGGSEYFHVEKDAATGKPVLKHTIRGGRDGSHVYNIREMTLNNCPVISPDVVVNAPAVPGSTPEK
jgi:hypothetical protein